jgi:hypothetical protein
MDHPIIETLFALFVTARNATIIGMAWTLTFIIGKILPLAWGKVYRLHIVPAIMLAVCLSAVWAPGLRPGLAEGQAELNGIDGSELGFRLALGIILAFAAYIVPVVLMWAAEKWLPAKTVKRIRSILL